MDERDEPRFLVDLNVGRLAKWLRVLGYDTLLLPNADDGELVRVALRQGRTIVTKDVRLCLRRVITSGLIPVVLVRCDSPRDQIRQVVLELGLSIRNGFTRCLRCNEPLIVVSKNEVAGRVPPYVYRTQEEFRRCPSCDRIYWKGTHWDNMRRELADALGF